MPLPILTAAQMRRCDEHTIRDLGIPSRTLMERAACGVARYLLDRPTLFGDGGVLVLCGSGNNGGDGFAAARFLSDGSLGAVRSVTVCYTGRLTERGDPDTARMSEECRRQYELACAQGLAVIPSNDLTEHLRTVTAVIDAVFGIGLDRPITGETAVLFDEINRIGLPILAVDIPSGIHADTGAVLGTALRATATVTMQALKVGLLLYPGADLCGDIAVCDLGIDTALATPPYVTLADEALVRRTLPPRARRSHKGTYGNLWMLCGSVGMCGAACLSASAAVRTGVGLVRVATPEANRPILQGYIPEAIITAYDGSAPDLRTISDSLAGHGDRSFASAAVIGCGLGTSRAAADLLRVVLDSLPADGSCPAVLDADALNLLARDASLWHTRLLSSRDKQVVITPHPAEMSRLCGKPVSEILADPIGTAQAFAADRGVVVVLKDAHTVIAAPDGTLYLCAAGNAGMAKGGSGDVLAGIIGSLLAQRKHSSATATSKTVAAVAAAGVALHALAGDATAEEIGEYAMTATDIVGHISTVTRALSDSRTVIVSC